jgi:hypothetical protein
MNLFRSLEFRHLPDENLLSILERLAGEGCLQNNRKLNVIFDCSCNSRLVEVICSMKNLEKLDMSGYDLTPEVLAHVFQSCSKLIELDVGTRWEYKTLEMTEHLKNQLKSGFQRLRCLDLVCFIDDDSWPVIQEMLT